MEEGADLLLLEDAESILFARGSIEPGSLINKTVAVFGTKHAPLAVWDLGAYAEEAVPELLCMDKQKGICRDYDPETASYTVQFFVGGIATVSEDNVLEVDEDATLDGGYDMAWPSGEVPFSECAASIVEHMTNKGYCVMQTFFREEERDAAVIEAQDLEHCHDDIKQEGEEDYLGIDNKTRACAFNDSEPMLTYLDSHLSLVADALVPFCSPYFNFTPESRSRSLARVPFNSEVEEMMLATEPFTDEEIAAGKLEAMLNFLHSRRVCMFFLANAEEGGYLTLKPRPSVKFSEVVLPLASNRMILFRHDMMTYSYRPEGEYSMAIHAWILSGQAAAIVPMGELTGVQIPKAPNCLVESVNVRLAGRSNTPTRYWSMFTAGTDCITEWDCSRFDYQMYWAPTRDEAQMTFKSYTKHGGFLAAETLTSFDNNFFGIPDSEAKYMYPGQRLTMEVGYETLYKAGHNKRTLPGSNIGFLYGYGGADWHYFDLYWLKAAGQETSMGTLYDEGSYQQTYSTMYKASMGTDPSVITGRIMTTFGLMGPTGTFSTACSSSLVATSLAHSEMVDKQYTDDSTRCERFLTGGLNLILLPLNYMVFSASSMLTHGGRSFTFNASADGFQRGEGLGIIYIRKAHEMAEFEDALACLAGSFVNQDGRSASLTAPHGPSQLAMIKRSLKKSNLVAKEVNAAECHGTGTALGDPIEVGAVEGALGKRPYPMFLTSAKSIHGHLEFGAGIAGFTKCILMLRSACTAPNCHFNLVNPHLKTEGFPMFVASELCDHGSTSSHTGVSSFGATGTNGRADVVGRATIGARTTGPMSFEEPRRTQALMPSVVYVPTVRELGKCYCAGTWNAFSNPVLMTEASENTLVAHIPLGELRCEQFQIWRQGDPSQAYYPMQHLAGPETTVMGPDEEGSGIYWLIDGRSWKDDWPAGTVYEIRFSLDGRKGRVSWQATGDGLQGVVGANYQHRWFIAGSCTNWTCKEMEIVSKSKSFKKMEFETTFDMGERGFEEFQFARDLDFAQAVYPASRNCEDQMCAMRGPDDGGAGLNWLVRGKPGEEVKVTLKISDGQVSMKMHTKSGGTKTWGGDVGKDKAKYYLTGNFCDWDFHPLEPVDENSKVYMAEIVLNSFFAEFQISRDRDMAQVYYPEYSHAESATSAPLGPSARTAGRCWLIKGEVGNRVQVTVNWQEPEPNKRVSWQLLEDAPALEDGGSLDFPS